MTVADAPTREIGSALTTYPIAIGAPGQLLVDSTEETAELRFPESAIVYDRMRKTDGQHAAVLRAAMLPLQRTAWRLSGGDVNPKVMAFVESELGLAGRAGRQRRRGQGVVWSEHLRLAMLQLVFGFMPFEQVYVVGPPSAGQEGLSGDVAHLRKLAPRLPRTLTQTPRVERDGGLAGIVQTVAGAAADKLAGTSAGEAFIPVDRLAMFVHEREGADWTGTSIFRASYKHWLIKDGLLRLGPMVAERNGMGVPVVYFTEEADRKAALDIATRVRAGADSGAALKNGMKLDLVGVSGSTRDELPLIRYHDEAAGRSTLAMFLNLGHDRGSQSLGETFADFFVMSLDAVADSIAETTTEHVIRDLVELNFGPDEAYPVLLADPIGAEATPTAEALKSLSDAGLLGSIDPDLVGEVRRRYGLPALPALPEADEVEDVSGNLIGLTGAGPGPAPAPPAALAASSDLPSTPAGSDPIAERVAALAERVAALRAG